MSGHVPIKRIPLQSPHSWMATLSSALDVGVLVLSPDKKLAFSSRLAAKLLGASGPDELESRWDELLPALENALGGALEQASSTLRASLEFVASGVSFRHRWSIYPLSEETCEGFLCLIKDLATIEALEEELQIATRFMSFARLYMVVAHDLRAPLNAMGLNIELLKQSLSVPDDEPGITEKRSGFVEVIGEELSRLARSLDSFLRQSEPPRESEDAFDFGEMVREAVALMSPVAAHQKMTIDADIPERPLVVRGHRDALKQALVNMSINALDAMTRGGRLTFVLEAREGRMVARIKDTGEGIPTEHLDRIWEMFFTTKARGSGIGLFVARSIVDRHGGDLAIESTGPDGTCFKLVLPLEEEA